jgi:hypothetical protein
MPLSQASRESLARAVELLEAGSWQPAHEIVQKEDSTLAAWLHGIVHILEGDLRNAEGWYKRANRPFPGAQAAKAEIAAARREVQAESA